MASSETNREYLETHTHLRLAGELQGELHAQVGLHRTVLSWAFRVFPPVWGFPRYAGVSIYSLAGFYEHMEVTMLTEGNGDAAAAYSRLCSERRPSDVFGTAIVMCDRWPCSAPTDFIVFNTAAVGETVGDALAALADEIENMRPLWGQPDIEEDETEEDDTDDSDDSAVGLGDSHLHGATGAGNGGHGDPGLEQVFTVTDDAVAEELNECMAFSWGRQPFPGASVALLGY